MTTTVYIPTLARRVSTDDVWADLRSIQLWLSEDRNLGTYPLTAKQYQDALEAALTMVQEYTEPDDVLNSLDCDIWSCTGRGSYHVCSAHFRYAEAECVCDHCTPESASERVCEPVYEAVP